MVEVLEEDIVELYKLSASRNTTATIQLQNKIKELLSEVDKVTSTLEEKGIEYVEAQQNNVTITDTRQLLNQINFYIKRVNDCITANDSYSLTFAMGVCSLIRESLVTFLQVLNFRPMQENYG